MESDLPRPECPPITPALIRYLETNYPDVMPNDFPGEFEYGKRVGAVQVVRHLKRVMQEQEEK